ncbi:MAG: hypothetical protein IPJ26_15880 [Bacteroidetes bacterium]|nr:hypothetical protein [Bacteroidota bacterium]
MSAKNQFLGGEGVSTKTNEDGWAEFTFHNLIEYWIDAEVYIGREEAIDFTFEDGDTTSFTYSHD